MSETDNPTPRSLALVKTGHLTGEEIALTFGQRVAAARSSGEQLDLMDVSKEAAGRKERQRLRRTCAELAFAYYTAKLGHPRAILTPERERLIMKRLEECGDDVSALLYAIDGVHADDWVMGRDPKAPKRRDTPEFVFHNWGRIEQHAESRPGYNQGKPHPMAAKYGLAGHGERQERRA